MEQPLATMGSTVTTPPVDTPTATPEDSPAFLDQSQTHPSSPINEASPTTADQFPSKGKNEGEIYVTPKNPEALVCKKTLTAKRSLPRILVLLTCVFYLLFHSLGVDLGLRLVEGYTEPRLRRAELQLLQAKGDELIDDILHSELDNLLRTTLDRSSDFRHPESFEYCLARGIYTANEVFYRLDFTRYPDIRNQTMDWVTDNCGRLLHTPQVHNAKAFKLRTTANNLRLVAKKAFNFFKYKAALFRYRWLGIDAHVVAKPVAVGGYYDAKKPAEYPPHMPFGFDLDCNELSPCRLVYSGSPNLSTNSKTLKDAVISARKEVKKWSWSYERARRLTGYVTSLLSILQFLLANFFMFTMFYSRPWPQMKSGLPSFSMLALVWPRIYSIVAHLQQDEKLALGLIVNTALYALLHHQVGCVISEFDRLLLPLGLGICAFHIPQILAFFDPASAATESVGNFSRSIENLYPIAKGAEVPDPALKKDSASARDKMTASSKAKPASKIAARFISPLTPISEDLQQERKAMHMEQGKRPRHDLDLETGYATETDSEYESDVQHASYVDLTGGATPTVSEDGSDWFVVED